MIILLAAAVISALTGDLTSFIIISTIVLMSAVLDTVQEYRAEQAAEHLKVSVALKEQVLRDGQVRYWGRISSLAMSYCWPPGIWSRRMGVSSRPGIFSSTRHC